MVLGNSLWLFSLLSGNYTESCPNHSTNNSKKAVGKFFCYNCLQRLCDPCSTQHTKQRHYVLRVRQTSYRDSIHEQELRNLIDVSDIQKVSINSEDAIYLKSNNPNGGCPQKPTFTNRSSRCIYCGSSTKPDSKYCSLSCKVIKHSNNCCHSSDEMGILPNGVCRLSAVQKRKAVLVEEPSSYRKMDRKRKGVPRRSPMF